MRVVGLTTLAPSPMQETQLAREQKRGEDMRTRPATACTCRVPRFGRHVLCMVFCITHGAAKVAVAVAGGAAQDLALGLLGDLVLGGEGRGASQGAHEQGLTEHLSAWR